MSKLKKRDTTKTQESSFWVGRRFRERPLDGAGSSLAKNSDFRTALHKLDII